MKDMNKEDLRARDYFIEQHIDPFGYIKINKSVNLKNFII